jgi:hypothetical protein
MGVGPFSLAIGSIDIGDYRRIAAAPGPVIAGIGPQLAGLGPPAPRIEHRGGGLVGEEPLGSSQPFEDMVAQGSQVPGRSSDPVGQCRTVEPDALPGVDLGLPVQRQVIGVLGDQYLRDQRLGRNAALDDPCLRRGLDDRALAGAATVARPARDQYPEGGRHDVEPLGHILADPVERTAAAGAVFVLDIDSLFDPLEMRGQRTPVGLAGTIAARPTRLRFAGGFGLGQRCLDIFEPELQLVGIELLGTGAEAMAHEGVENGLQPLYLGIGRCPCDLQRIEFASLLEDERTQRVNVIGKVCFHEHESTESAEESPVKRQSSAPLGGARHVPGASPIPPVMHPAVPPLAASRRPGCRASGSRSAQAAWPSGTGPCRPTR